MSCNLRWFMREENLDEETREKAIEATYKWLLSMKTYDCLFGRELEILLNDTAFKKIKEKEF